MSDQIKYLLDEDQIPKSWYNIQGRFTGTDAAGASPWHPRANRPGGPGTAFSRCR